MKILIVEDEVIAASYLKQIILNAGHDVVGIVGTGQGAIALAKSKKPDLILMDIMLEDNISGVDAAVNIYYIHPEIMIVFLTAFTESSMIETAKEANTVGYFLKPYNKEEIVTNLEILASKHSLVPQVDKEIIQLLNHYNFNPKLQQLFFHTEEITLTQKELQLIALLCEHKHLLLSFEEIIVHLWNKDTPHQTLRSLIYRIRQKTHVQFIVSVSKRGYKISLSNYDYPQ